MSNENTSPEPKKKSGKLKLILFSLVLLGAGGGGTYAAFASGIVGEHSADPEDNNPNLVLKGEEDPFPYGETDAKDKTAVVHGAGGGEYRTAYYNFTEEFTSNLVDGAALIQVSLAASTHYDGRVLMWLAEHETALRSRILAELAATSEMEVVSIRGKEELQTRLTHAINETLEEREGFGGVDRVYFRSFIVQ
ncbi:flagellar basal body-associated protein FliL [Erythrobacter sp. SD-21]|uniref:flagellar basal body-associated FliL family protein n=1 Tax=Erythrobacter sp. SD-21 TaxID=161528 RepID=UPI000153F82D|nr:flagellar basal body-associated FliL family protein [Erythrobacter sp. SD-21]EDL49937.1 flagellar basal body-associated protein FliL [Erythrobacter sp. SD-21]